MRYHRAMRWFAPFALSLLIAFFLSACEQGRVEHQESFVFGTRVEIVAWSRDDGRAQEAMGAVLREFDRLHHAYHAWQPSQLTALNERISHAEPAPVDDEMAQLIGVSKHYSQASHELFEPAIGGLISAWGFQRDEFSPHVPAQEEIARWVAAHPVTGDVSIENDVARSSNRSVRFDFGGLVKGYALDRAAAILKQYGIRDALVNIGGNILALGSKNGTAWQVGIQNPRGAGPIATVSLYDGEAIGTSGDYQRYFEIDGRRYCHLIDPRTGMPSEASQAVTVLVMPRDDAGMLSDVASKPIFLAGDDWPASARNMGVEHVVRIRPDGRIELTDAMRARIRWIGGQPDVTVRELPAR